jgi:hypothetical protein
MAHDPREVWAKRVERWSDSGLTAKEYAAETGLNANTLMHWKWRLGAEARRRQRAPRPIVEAVQFVEITPPAAVAQAPAIPVSVASPPAPAPVPAIVDEPLEVILRDGLRIRVPVQFDPGALRRVVAALELAR